jgi:peptide/nickel transport system substrate-binding protein
MAIRSRRSRRLLIVGSSIAIAGLILGACTKAGSGPSQSHTVGGKPQKGGVATWALPPAAVPNWIFPFIDPAHSTIDNRNQFDYLMYRPLYWFGNNGQPVINPAVSLANLPVYSNGNKTVTIALKPYRWSNGETVTSQDVAFWLNMMLAERAQWAYYVPGGLPDNLSGYKILSPTTIQLSLKSAYSPSYFTNNELSQITPLPLAWDKTSDSSQGHCASSVSACPAVWKYLHSLSEKVSTYDNSPVWRVVDGPWYLASYQTTGLSVFKPNPKYSGPVKPRLSEFVEQPFTTESAELDVLRSGKISVGYLPTTDLGQKDVIARSGYNLNVWVDAGINYFPYNFNNPTVGPVFKQLYFRQAVQHLINQPEYISKIFQGYASPDYGGVPNSPPNPYIDNFVKSNPYKFSVSAARQLLTSHGWTVPSNGAATCTSAGTGASNCGAGIKSGTKMSFNLLYASGTTTLTQEVQDMKSVFSQVGIVLNLSQAPFDQVISQSVACKPSQASCKWQLNDWGGGWSYSMDHFPNGDLIFGSGAGDNSGSYSNPQNDQLITQSDHVPGAITAVEDYQAKDLPAVFMPKADYSLTEIQDNLHGVIPQEPTFNMTPENWYFTKG